MGVLQFAKRSVVTVATLGLLLSGCEGSPDVPFNPTGTTEDMEAVNSSFESSAMASFSTFGLMFDAALGGSPIVTASKAALEVRNALPSQGDGAAVRAAALRSARRLAAMVPRGSHPQLSASVAALPSEVAGKTFVYDAASGSYIVSDRPSLALDRVRFILYAVDPVTREPVTPLVETGYVELIDRTSGSTNAAQVLLVSGGTTYLDYTVFYRETATSGSVTVNGYVTNGSVRANIYLRASLTATGGLTLSYTVSVPQRDVSIELSLSASDVAQGGTITLNLEMVGPNCFVTMTGQFSETTGSIVVRVNAEPFARINTDGTVTTITGYNGEPLADDEMMALNHIFLLSQGAFLTFDLMLAPVGAFFE
jgi:hypothetical protein